MALTNCERCNRVFNKLSSSLCPACVEEEEKDFHVVNEALRARPDQTIEELAETTGVSKKTILRLLKDERIASNANVVGVTCGKCGAPAISRSVRLCHKCAGQMARTVARACSDVQAGAQASDKEEGEPDEGTDESVHEAYQRKTGRS